MTTGTDRSLATVGNGIFETHVTWEDIEHDMCKAMKTSATFGPNKKAINIGEGNGFGSRICLIEPDWQNKAEGEVLPDKFVGKLCTAIAILAFMKKLSDEKGIKSFLDLEAIQNFDDKLRQIHNNEAHIYHLLNKYDVTAIPRAKIYTARTFTEDNLHKGFLLMEYMDDLSLVHIFSTIKPEEMDQALRALAAFEALTFKITQEEKQNFCSKPLSEMMNMLFTENSVQSFKDFLKKYDGEKYQKEVNELTTIIHELVDTVWCDSIPDQLGMTPVLCHGDLWSTNVLWKKYGDEQKIAAIIDYQTAHLGNPAGDLSRILCSNLSGDDRKNHTDALLEKFYHFLQEDMGNHAMPYTLEQLKEAYRRYQPVSGFMLVPMFGSAADIFIDKIPEKERAHAKHVLDEKLGSLVVEVLELHKRNKNIRGQE